MLYRLAGAGSRLRKYTIGPYGRVTLHQARIAAQKIFAARVEGRDPAAEKQLARRRLSVDLVEDLVELFITEHISKTRSANDLSRRLRREVIPVWGNRSVHEIRKRDVIDLVHDVLGRGTPIAANKLLKTVKGFFSWCVGRAILEVSPAAGIPPVAREVRRDRVLDDDELVQVIVAARQVGDPYAGIVEMLALTGQRREEIAQMTWDEVDLASRCLVLDGLRTKNGKRHLVHLSEQTLTVLNRQPRFPAFVFSLSGSHPFRRFSAAKRELDRLSGVSPWRLHDLRRTCVSGMARLGVAPHVADKILNHQCGTISGVAAVYQQHEFLEERRQALDIWGTHVEQLLSRTEDIAA